MKTNIYIDAFNLYYGALRGTPHKWLDPLAMCKLVLRPHHEFHRVRYFTALVTPRPHDPDQRLRQEAYLRALRTLPNTTIHLGFFLTHKISMPVADTDPPRYVTVIKTEEKGSDVNLATHLLNDAHRGDYECAVVVSNDSDLVEPIKIVRNQLNLPVIVLNPHRKRPSVELRRESTFFKDIRPNALTRSQFAATMNDANGTIRKPAGW